VTDQPLRSDQHYVPCTYLKRWASSDGRIWTYRTLVSSPHVPLWKAHGPKGVAYHRHLYTRVMAGQETDTFEQWLDAEIETPAAEALEKATSDAQLTPDDWKRLVRFLAAQQVRTPRWFEEQVRHWKESVNLLAGRYQQMPVLILVGPSRARIYDVSIPKEPLLIQDVPVIDLDSIGLELVATDLPVEFGNIQYGPNRVRHPGVLVAGVFARLRADHTAVTLYGAAQTVGVTQEQ
jgi:hypothetical protein